MCLRTKTICGFVTDECDAVLTRLAEFLKTLPDEDIVEVRPEAQIKERKMWMEIHVVYREGSSSSKAAPRAARAASSKKKS